MSSFTAPVAIEPAGDVWRTTRTIDYEIGKLGSGLLIRIPAGTVTDLGTIPRLLWPILAPHDPKAAAAFVLHDMLCRDRGFSRLIADAVFLDALLILAVPKWRAVTMFLGVRASALIRGE